MSSGKQRPFCLGFNVLTSYIQQITLANTVWETYYILILSLLFVDKESLLQQFSNVLKGGY